jgi:hypothetical protein
MGLTDYTISDKKYWQAGRDYERKQILKYLNERIDDFKACTKNDCCDEHIYVLQGIIEDIEGRDQE